MTNTNSIYLDYAAATPVDPRVTQAMRPYLDDQFYNPSATYQAAREVKQAVESARAQAAHWLGAKSSEIVFTAGGTEANNLAVHGVMRKSPEANIVIGAIEHESVIAPAGNYDCRQAKVIKDGRINLEDLASKIDDHTALVSVMYANNEIGTIQPIRQIAQLIAKKRRSRGAKGLPLYFHTDACQAANYLDLHVARLGVDLMTINGGKIYGPKQTALLYVKAGLELKPLIDGGGQERGLRSGTENVAGIIGLAKALDLVQADRQAEVKRLQELQKLFIDQLNTGLPDIQLNGSLKYRLPNNLHLTIPGQDNERLLIQLDQSGIMAAASSACSASNEEPSHVLRAIGLGDSEAQSSLRLTMGRQTIKLQIKHTVKVLEQLLP